jgi:hypothetical protein
MSIHIKVIEIPSEYKVSTWNYSWFPTNAKGSPLSKYHILKPELWVAYE